MTAVEVVVPWRPGCHHRTVALHHVLNLYRTAGFTPTVAGYDADPWVKARAVTPAVEASDADLIVMADADCWPTNLHEALEAVESAPWAVPHWTVYRLTADATRAVLDGTRPLDETVDCERPPYRGFAGGGVVILPRSTYLDVPLDPRFEGWSGEDESWARALSTLVGEPWRGIAPLYHLWHPPQPRMNHRHGSPASQALTFNYRQAKGRPAQMRQLVEEGRATWPTSSSASNREPSSRS